MTSIVDTLSHYFAHFHEHTDSLRSELPIGWSSLVGVAGASLIAATGYNVGARAVKKRKRTAQDSRTIKRRELENGREENILQTEEEDTVSTCSRKSSTDTISVASTCSDDICTQHHVNKIHDACLLEKKRREKVIHKFGGKFVPIDGGCCYVQVRDPIDQQHDFMDDDLDHGYYPTNDQFIQLNYLDAAQIVVMVPGHFTLSVADSLSSVEMYDKLATHLNRKGIRVILFDFLGRGYSSKVPHASHNVDSYVSQMRQIIEHLKLDEQKINMVACSTSTKVALHYTHLFERCAEQDDAHVQRLVLISPVGFEFSRKLSLRRVTSNLMRKSWFLSLISTFRDLDKMMLKRLTQGFSRRDHPSIERIKSHFAEAKDQNPNWKDTVVRKLVDFGVTLSDEVDEDLVALKNIAAGGVLDYENCEDHDEMVHALEVRHFPEEPLPVLLMWGKRDTVCMLSDLKPFSRYLPHARVEMFDDAGHCLLFEEEQLVQTSIVQFLTTTQH
jgi:pimeloyl-ACP methyl ester carboxylesterase